MTKFNRILLVFAIGTVATATACGGGSSSTSTSTSTSSGSGGGSSTTPNSVTLNVDAGPAALLAAGFQDEDTAFISITVCVPGTSNCQTIDHVEVDTGSEGLRIPTGVLNFSLPLQTASGNQVSECLGFGDGTFIWGPIASADIQIAGEAAHNVPVQLASTNVAPAASSIAGCSTDQTSQIASVVDFGANAILGVGLFRQDCGGGCATNANNDSYFGCPATGCTPITESLTTQVQNPVWMFPSDNNGVILQLPSVSGNGQASATGLLTFGIGTQSDNAVGSVTLLQPDVNTGNFGVQFNNVTYNDCQFPGCGPGNGSSFIDSGSNGIFFLDSQTLVNSGFAIPDCSGSGLQGFYCPSNTQQFTVNLFAENSSTGTIVGSPRQVQFSVGDAQTLLQSGSAAFNDIGGPSPNSFDFGLPFFFGRSVYFGIEGQSATGLGAGPFYAF